MIVYRVVHPLAIVQRGGIIYLVCAFADYGDVPLLALHRMKEALVFYEAAGKALTSI